MYSGRKNMAVVQFVLFSLLSVVLAATITNEETSSTSPTDSETNEGSLISPAPVSRTYKVDQRPGIVIVEYWKEMKASQNSANSEHNDLAAQEGLAIRLQEKVDKVFRGIIISGVLFVVCASICVISVCIFCCHIHRSDRKLKNEVNAMAKKLKIDINKKCPCPSARKKPLDQKEESCNVIVQDANIMCV